MSNPYESPKMDDEGSQGKPPLLLSVVLLIAVLFVLGILAMFVLSPAPRITAMQTMAPQPFATDVDADGQN